MAEQNEIGGKFTIDIEDLKNGITQANRLMKLADSEFKATAAGLGNWADSADGLTAKQRQLNTQIQLQQSKMSALKSEYTRVAEAMGENSAEAINLKIRINGETAAREKNRSELERVSGALGQLESSANGATDATGGLAKEEKRAAKTGEDAADSTESFGDKAKAVAKGGVKALATATTALVTAFFASAEGTREYRTEMGKLETAFNTAGISTKAAKKTYEELYAFMGEEDTAVEAANHLAKLVDNEKDLQKWTNISTGVFATFGDSLPIEGLTEAANETAKVGQVTGPLADALNWAGLSEDKFNESLAKCSNEQERQALITDTLNGLYSDASSKYKDVNKDIMAANEAQSKLNDSMAKMGEMAEPVMTILKTKAAEALNSFVGLFDGFNDVVSGDVGIGDFGAQLVERIIISITTGAPKLMQAGTQLLTSLATGIKNNLPTMLGNAVTMIDTMVVKLREGAPKMVSAGLAIIVNLVKGFMDSFPMLIEKVPTIVSNIAGIINDNAPTILLAGVNIIKNIVFGLIKAIPTLVLNIPKIIKAIVDVFLAFQWFNVGKSIINLFKKGFVGETASMKVAATKIKDSIVNAIKELPAKLFQIGKNAISFLKKALSNVANIKVAANKIATSVIEGVTKLPGKIYKIGADIVKGLWKGITDKASWIKDKVMGFGANILNSFKTVFDINSPSKKTEEDGKYLVLGIAKGIEKNSAYAKKVVKQFGDDLLTVLGNRLSNYSVYNNLTLKKEMEYWENSRKLFKKGTQDRIDADAKYYESKKSFNDQLKQNEKDYTTNVSAAYSKLKTDIDSLIQKYQDEVTARTDAITSSMGLFEEFTKNTETSGSQLLSNIKTQVEGIKSWIDTLQSLTQKGVDGALIEDLRQMGPASLGELEALNSLTEAELNEYVSLWQQKNSLAKTEAIKELGDLAIQTGQQIASLVTDTKTAITGYKKTYMDALIELGVSVKTNIETTDKTLVDTASETLLKSAPKIGEDTVQGIIDGLNAKSGSLYSAIASIMASTIAAAQVAADIASPSKIMRDLIGKNLVRGAIVGIESESSSLYATMRNVVDNTMGNAQVGHVTGQQLQAQSQQQIGTTVNFTQNNSSPKALSPYEIYRQTKIANKLITVGR